jgi:kumamolisin
MKRVLFLVVTALVIMIIATSGLAQEGRILPPPLNQPPVRVHPPIYIFIPNEGANPNAPPPNANNPGSVACVYGVTPPTSGCPITGSPVATGGAKAIAVVEYGQYSAVQSDFNTFNTQYGLPAQTLTQICYPNPPCPNNAGVGNWDIETALDIEYAHAMAPNAQIIIAEFTNDPLADGAEQGAANAVAALGGGEVSNSFTYNGGESWCSPPANCELSYDSYFVKNTVVFFAAAGDAGHQVNYPCISPNVVCAGGTAVVRSGGNFTGVEDCWAGSGGGISTVEPRPAYEVLLSNITGSFRGIPDLAAVASPSTGVAVYNITSCGGWCQVGGTSVASPVLAGITNASASAPGGVFQPSTNAELTKTYGIYGHPGQYRQPTGDFYDITSGSNGFSAVFLWDRCTGIGSPRNPYKGM